MSNDLQKLTTFFMPGLRSGKRSVAESSKQADDDGDVLFVGDMTSDEMAALLADALQQALAPLVQSMTENMASVSKAITEAPAAAGSTKERLTSTSTVKSKGGAAFKMTFKG